MDPIISDRPPPADDASERAQALADLWTVARVTITVGGWIVVALTALALFSLWRAP